MVYLSQPSIVKHVRKYLHFGQVPSNPHMLFGLGKTKMAQQVSEMLKGAVVRLPPIESSSFGSHFDSFGSSRIVLIGDGR